MCEVWRFWRCCTRSACVGLTVHRTVPLGSDRQRGHLVRRYTVRRMLLNIGVIIFVQIHSSSWWGTILTPTQTLNTTNFSLSSRPITTKLHIHCLIPSVDITQCFFYLCVAGGEK